MNSTTHAVIALAFLAFSCASVDSTTLGTPADDAVDLDAMIAENDANIAQIVAGAQQMANPVETRRWIEQQDVFQRDPTAEIQRKFSSTLTDGERSKLETYFAATGVALDSLTFSGRIIAQGDTLLDADDLLAALAQDVVEKGRTPAAVIPGTNNGIPVGPAVFTRCSPAAAPTVTSCASIGAAYQFFRPILTNYFVIVPDSPAFVFDLVLQATNTLENISGDAISSSVYNVIRQTDYNNLDSVARATAHSIQISYGAASTVCSNGALAACCVFPRLQSILLSPFPNTTFDSHMALGVYMGIGNTVTSNTQHTRGIILHELQHGLGIAHPHEIINPQPVTLYVPGTATDVVSSNMISTSASPFWSETLTAEDIDMIKTLYPAGVSYVRGFSTVNAN